MCDACEIVVINGVLCHESGCPDSWRDETRECRECGREFSPADRRAEHCDEQCRYPDAFADDFEDEDEDEDEDE